MNYGNPIGPYLGTECRTEVDHGLNGQFMIFAYSAYNANGLIGSECNGVAVLMKNRGVVIDGISCQPFAGVTDKMRQMAKLLAAMAWEEFRDFINGEQNNNHHRRFKLEGFRAGACDTMKMTREDRKRLVTLLMGTHIDAYSDAGEARKIEFANLAKRYLHEIANKLGLKHSKERHPPAGFYHVSFNPGGIAGAGDVYLDAEGLHVNLTQSCLGPGYGFMYRCANAQYSGPNKHMRFETLLTPTAVVTAFKNTMEELEPDAVGTRIE